MKQNILSITLIVVALITTGCAERITTHGQIIKTKNVQRIVKGTHNKEDVQYLLGSPSAVGTFNKNTWYYLTEKKVSKPLKDDKIIERRIVTITFDKNGIVKTIDDKTTTNIPQMTFNEKITPTYGQKLGIIDQMIENIGPGNF